MKVILLVRSAMLTVGVGLAAIAPASGGSIYLKIPGVTGPVTKSGFSGDIELTAYSQGFTNPASSSSGTGASGRVTCGAINIGKLVDLTSQDFLEYVTRGTVIHTATVYFTGNNPNTIAATARYSIVLTNVRVTSMTQGDTASNTAGLGITENISLVAEKFQVTYATSNPDASSGNTETYGWDCVTNAAT
jgi:type VI protein secretion system component Hcp